jgi:glycosyltransferase involved in cell wall biosynthesis
VDVVNPVAPKSRYQHLIEVPTNRAQGSLYDFRDHSKEDIAPAVLGKPPDQRRTDPYQLLGRSLICDATSHDKALPATTFITSISSLGNLAKPAVSHKGPLRNRPRLAVGIDLRPLVDPHFRGFARYTHEIANALAARPGLDIIGFTDRDLAQETSIRLVRFDGRREIVREQWSLPRLLARERIDVFFCPANRGLPFCAPCPTVLTLHDVADWDGSLVLPAHGKSRLRFIYASVASLAGASLILTVSHSSAEAIVRRLGVAPWRVRPVYEAANARFHAKPSSDDEVVRRRLGVTSGYILYVSGFDRKKDLLTLVRSLALLRDLPEAQVVIAGQAGAEADQLLHAAHDLRVHDRIHLLGYVPEGSLPALYRGARCFVFPALAEGFGLPVIEAMACGTPVVAAAAGSLPEVIGDGGQLFKPRDPIGLSHILRQLLIDNHLRDHWAGVAKARAARFSWAQAAQFTEDVLREAASEPRSRGWARRVGRVPGTLVRCVLAERN